MPDDKPRLLLDQNVGYPVTNWLRDRLPQCEVYHTRDLDLSRMSDQQIFAHAQSPGAAIVTFDEDFAYPQLFPECNHHGVIRLKVSPTTDEVACNALDRLFKQLDPASLRGKLVIVDTKRIRIRMFSRGEDGLA